LCGREDPLHGPWIVLANAPRIERLKDGVIAVPGRINAGKGLEGTREITATFKSNLIGDFFAGKSVEVSRLVARPARFVLRASRCARTAREIRRTGCSTLLSLQQAQEITVQGHDRNPDSYSKPYFATISS
jgi:hypothetical protein